MRNSSGNISLNDNGRIAIFNNENFTYAHFQIGRPGRRNRIGFATVGGLRYGNDVYYAVALCSPDDNFSKREGRERVEEHLILPEHSGKRGMIGLDEGFLDDSSPAQVFKVVLAAHLQKPKNLPPWTRQEILHRREGLGLPRIPDKIVIGDNAIKAFRDAIGNAENDPAFKITIVHHAPIGLQNESRSKAARRGWQTRRNHAKEGENPGRTAALKGWETRRNRRNGDELGG